MRCNAASTVEIILADIENSFNMAEELTGAIELCLANTKRYAEDIVYESHIERCANSVEYKSEQKSGAGEGCQVILHV